MNIIVRSATEDDAEALSAIYAPYTDTAVTFECHAPDATEFAARIRNVSTTYPFLVCEIDGNIIGYCYSHRLREREAYDWDAELSIYLDMWFTGKGAGRALYTALLDLMALQGFKNAYGCMVIPNEKSERLHQSCGFTEVGVWRRTGYKLGRWYDLKWFEKPLAPLEDNPPRIIPFPLLDREATASVLKACQVRIQQNM